MKIFKPAIFAFALLGLSSAYADGFSWEPHLIDQYHCPQAPNYCALKGEATFHIANDSDDVHRYHINLGVSSDAGPTLQNAGVYQEDIVIQPHTTFTEHHAVGGYVKFNFAGSRKISLYFLSSGQQQFSASQYGYVYV